MMSVSWRTTASCLSRSSPKLRGSFPAGKTGGIATPAAQQASAKCSSAADTPAADVDPVKAKVMYAVQQPLATSAFGDVMGVPAWKTLPSWYLVAADDQAIPPDAERQFAARMGATTVEIPSSHVPMVSHPGDVTQLIKTAAEAVPATS